MILLIFVFGIIVVYVCIGVFTGILCYHIWTRDLAEADGLVISVFAGIFWPLAWFVYPTVLFTNKIVNRFKV